jgi:hypothetical protein
VISILREAHRAVEEARARGDTALDPGQLGQRVSAFVPAGVVVVADDFDVTGEPVDCGERR